MVDLQSLEQALSLVLAVFLSCSFSMEGNGGEKNGFMNFNLSLIYCMLE